MSVQPAFLLRVRKNEDGANVPQDAGELRAMFNHGKVIS